MDRILRVLHKANVSECPKTNEDPIEVARSDPKIKLSPTDS
jgi:hypothetical protein